MSKARVGDVMNKKVLSELMSHSGCSAPLIDSANERIRRSKGQVKCFKKMKMENEKK